MTNNISSVPSFCSRVKVIKNGKDACHTGLIKVLGLENDFNKGIKELSKETRKKVGCFYRWL